MPLQEPAPCGNSCAGAGSVRFRRKCDPVNIVLTFLAGALVGLLFLKLKIPGGMIVGAIFGTLLLSLTLHCAEMPYPAKFSAQCITGAFIGCTMDREDLDKLKSVWKPALTVVLAFLAVNLILGFGISALGSMDLLTALLSTVAGGMSEVTLAASDMGADTSKVVLLQFVRMCYGVGLFPVWIAWLDRKNTDLAAISRDEVKKKSQSSSKKVLALTFAVAFLCGGLGRISGMPSGVLVFAILGTLALNLLVVPVHLPRPIRRLAQLLSGTYIGCSIPYESLYGLHKLLIPALLGFLVFMANAYFTGHFIHRRFSVPIREAMLMATPAGASDMMLISADIGVQSTSLLVVHILRMLTSAALMPQIDYLVASLFVP